MSFELREAIVGPDVESATYVLPDLEHAVIRVFGLEAGWSGDEDRKRLETIRRFGGQALRDEVEVLEGDAQAMAQLAEGSGYILPSAARGAITWADGATLFMRIDRFALSNCLLRYLPPLLGETEVPANAVAGVHRILALGSLMHGAGEEADEQLYRAAVLDPKPGPAHDLILAAFYRYRHEPELADASLMDGLNQAAQDQWFGVRAAAEFVDRFARWR